MTTRGQDITAVLKRQIEEFGGETTLTEVGTVVEVGDGIATIHGLSKSASANCWSSRAAWPVWR